MEEGDYVFEADYGYAGPVAVLYPGGTKPIVSGLAALQAEEDAVSSDADIDEASE